MSRAILEYPSGPPQAMAYESTRRVFVPGMLALVIPWLLVTAIGKAGINFTWALRVQIAFLHVHVFPLLHWDKMIAFAIAGVISAMFGSFIGNSAKQGYFAALFPVAFEILKWGWLLGFRLPSWIDPYHPPYRFMSLPISASIGYWIIHILLPAGAAMGGVWCSNRWLISDAAPSQGR